MIIPPFLVYALSVAVGTACAILLYRGNRRAPSRLLLSASLCFTGLVLNDLGLMVDLFVLPDISLITVRSLPALFGLAVLVRALVKEDR
jgi:hypothetical protein